MKNGICEYNVINFFVFWIWLIPSSCKFATIVVLFIIMLKGLTCSPICLLYLDSHIKKGALFAP
jgi:hypothetical protein